MSQVANLDGRIGRDGGAPEDLEAQWVATFVRKCLPRWCIVGNESDHGKPRPSPPANSGRWATFRNPAHRFQVFRCTLHSLHPPPLQCIAPRCTALHVVAVHCTSLQCIARHCTALQVVAPHCVQRRATMQRQDFTKASTLPLCQVPDAVGKELFERNIINRKEL